MSREFYHEDAYLKLEADYVNGEPFFYKFNNITGGIPLIKRRIMDSQYYDSVSPYGYPGILFDNYHSELVNRELKMFKEYCEAENIVTTFLRMSPVYNDFLLEEDEYIKHIIHGRVVTIPMSRDYEELQKDYSSNHRRGLKKLFKGGFSVSEEPLDSIIEFLEIYTETMTRLNASSYYLFSLEYFERLFNLNSEKKLIFVRDINGTVASAALFFISKEVIQYHLAGTRQEYIKNSPNKLIFDYVIREYSNKKKYFVLGGGLNNEEDSLYHFKLGFSKVTRKFSTVRMVHLKDQYLNLCKNRDLSKDEIMKFEGYFPLYRKA